MRSGSPNDCASGRRPSSNGFPGTPPARAAVLALLAATAGAGVSPAPPVSAGAQQERMIGPGVKHVTLRRSTGPCVANVVEVDLSQPYVRLGTSRPAEQVVGVLRLSALAGRQDDPRGRPIAAINGDHFIPERGRFHGLPIGASISDGEVFHSPYPRSALIIGKDGRARIAILKMQGTVVRADGTEHALTAVNHPRDENALVLYTPRFGASTRTANSGTEVLLESSALPLRHGDCSFATAKSVLPGAGNTGIPAGGLVLSGVGSGSAFLKGVRPGDRLDFFVEFDPPVGPQDEVIGGGPRLVRDGRVSVEDEANVIARTGGRSRQPRTAVGIRDGHVFLVTVDGRRKGVSVGMTFWELAKLMTDLGCQQAMALDGGGSTTMWVRGDVRNRPSDGRERPVASGLVVFSSAPIGPPRYLTVTPSRLAMVAGSTATFQVSAEDEFYNPLSVAPRDLRWAVDPRLAAVDAAGRLVAGAGLGGDPGTATEVTAWAEVGQARVPVQLRLYNAPPRIRTWPTRAQLRPGQTLRLQAAALDEASRPLLCPAGAIRWECPAELGRIQSGSFKAGTKAGAGWLVASMNGAAARVPVGIGTVTRPVADFEEETAWSSAAFPETTKVTTGRCADRAWRGSGSLKLAYHFAAPEGSRVACARAALPIGPALRLRAAVWGDGSQAALRARVIDSRAQTFNLPLAEKVSWKDAWREVTAPVPAAARAPLTLDSIYLVQEAAGAPAAGEVLIDGVRADYVPDPELDAVIAAE